MKREEFSKVKIGDVVEITVQGKNKGKQGVVRDIRIDANYGGQVYLEPLNCEFEFHNSTYKARNEEGFCRYSHFNIAFPEKPKLSDKVFYFHRGFKDGVAWSTENFTKAELEVINRFLIECDENADYHSFSILDKTN